MMENQKIYERNDKLAEIPREILEDVLTRLPMKSLRRFKCVSNEWCNMISSPYFRQLRNRRSSTDFGGLLILLGVKDIYSFDYHNIDQGATKLQFPDGVEPFNARVCNGLLCFEMPNSRLALYNPATRAYKELRPCGSMSTSYISYEFAYDSLSSDYKVIRFASQMFHRGSRLHVYSLKANAWEVIQTDQYDPVHFSSSLTRSVFTNKSLHWLDPSVESRVIWRFDLSTLNYQKMPLPREISDSREQVTLANLKGCLHLITNRFEIWVMEEYGVAQSWTKLFHGIELSLARRLAEGSYRLPSAYAYSKDGMNILVSVWNGSARKYICCDIEHQTASKFEIPGLPIEMNTVFTAPWVESNVSLDLNEVSLSKLDTMLFDLLDSFTC